LRVAILAPWDLDSVDGNSVRSRGIVPIIAAAHPTIVFDMGSARTAAREYAGAPLLRLSYEGKGPLRFLVANFKFIRESIRNNVDLVYAEGALFLLPALFLVSRLAKIRFIYEAHALGHRENAQWSAVGGFLWRCLESFMGKSASGVVALSGQTHRFFLRFNRNVFFVPVFIDMKLFRPRDPGRQESVGPSAGLVGPFKGQFNRFQLDFLAENLSKLDSRIKVTTIGKLDAPIVDGRVKNLGFVKGESEYARELAKLDALLVPVKIGTFGPKNKILEVMACGVPVFTTPEGTFGLDFARPDENIFVFPEDELVRQLNSLIFQPGIREVGLRGRAMVEHNYSEGVCSTRLLDAISLVAGQK